MGVAFHSIQPFGKTLRHALALVILTVSHTLCIGAGDILPAAQDSVFLEGTLPSEGHAADGHFSCGFRIDDQHFAPGDSISGVFPKKAAVMVWARAPEGQLQFETALTGLPDSAAISFLSDSAGFGVVLGIDTLLHPWGAAQDGCFPSAAGQAVRQFLNEVREQPFESQRFALLKAWIPAQCLTLEQLAECTAVFDDEGRRLQLIQCAQCVAPERLRALDTSFASRHYREAFRQWLSESP